VKRDAAPTAVEKLPAGHSRHDVACVASTYPPAAHAVQFSARAPEKAPAGHARHWSARLGERVPAGHVRHVAFEPARSAVEYWPAPQGAHVDAALAPVAVE